MNHHPFQFTAVLAACTLVALPACAQIASNSTLAGATPITTARDAKAFVHPGLLHTEADFARMKRKVAEGQQPWFEGWKRLIANPRAQLGWKARATDRVVRGAVPGQNVALFFNDAAASYQLALRWKVSGDEAYARKAVEVLNAWGQTLRAIEGNSDRFLAAGIQGYQFANAAEIMRTYPGWKKEDFAQFRKMMLEVVYPMNRDFLTRHNDAAITNYWANWDLCNLASMQAIGVLCDRRDIYDQAMNYVYAGGGNGAVDKAIYYLHSGHLGQWQESGRDQGHNTLGIALIGPICETAWNQGDDLYGYDNNRVLAGAEYVAKYNLGGDVPFQPYAWGTGQRGERREQTEISPAARGNIRPGWELIVHHYTNRRGIAAPYSAQFAAKVRPEGGGGDYGPNSGGFDQLGLGTLTDTLDPQVLAPKPSGLVARKSGGAVVLSWWGSVGATSYRVKRATKMGGPFETIADNLQDTLAYTDRDLKSGKYFYAIGALKEGKEIASSPLLEVTTVATLRTLASTLHGGATRETGGAIALNGRNAYLQLPAGVVSDLADFSVAARVWLNENKTWARVFDFGDERGRTLFLTPKSSTGKLRFATGTVYGYNEQVIDSDVVVPTGQWVHLAVTLSGRVGTIYLNGIAVGSNANLDFPPFQIGHTSRNWIGRSQFPNDPYLDGKVDDFRLYDGALSGEQIAALAKQERTVDR